MPRPLIVQSIKMEQRVTGVWQLHSKSCRIPLRTTFNPARGFSLHGPHLILRGPDWRRYRFACQWTVEYFVHFGSRRHWGVQWAYTSTLPRQQFTHTLFL